MRSGTRIFRAAILLAGSALSLPSLALAQPAPPPGADPNAGGGDPPALAGRIARLRGTVSFHGPGEQTWHPAQINYPVTTGDALWTEPKSDTAIDVGADRIILAGATELDIAALDQANFTATAAQGAIFLRLKDLPDGQSLTINTPRAAVQITQPGRYEIVAGDSANATAIRVVEGAAHVQGNGAVLDVGPQQTASITGADQVQGVVVAMQPDAFLSAVLHEEAPRPQAAPPPQEVQYMTGGEDLAENGTWTPSPEYGQVWFPSAVAVGWAPYRFGHWAFVAPWGWTWVDNAPWGFAPFHYGRWVQWGGRWGWVAGAPGIAFARPVYAPALVGFIGFGGAGLAVGGIGFGIGSVGWVPLGFGEPFHPWYHTSPGYFVNVNRVNVTNINNINITRNVTVNNYANARFATVAPAGAMQGSRNLAGLARPVPEAALAHATPVEAGHLPVTPTAATAGVTPAVAHSYGLPAPAPTHSVGPAITPAAFHGATPALRPAVPGVTSYAHPVAAAAAVGAAAVAAHAVAAHAAAAHAGPTAGGLPPLVNHTQAGVRPASPAIAPAVGHPAAPAMAHTAAPAPLSHPVMPAVRRPASSYGTPHTVTPPSPHTGALPEVQRPTPQPEAPRPAFHPVQAPRPTPNPAPVEHAAPPPRPAPHPVSHGKPEGHH